MTSIVNIIIVFLLVLANGFFVASEFSLVAVRRSRVAELAESGHRKAQILLGLVDNLNAYISATQLGITLASLALGWIGEPAIARLLEAPLKGYVSTAVLHTISFTIAFSIITFLHIVLGELAPKTVALELSERTALVIARPMLLFYKTFYWPIRVLDWAGTRTVRLFGLTPSGEHGSIYTENELRQLIDTAQQGGHIELGKRELINGVFDFSGVRVREAMIPRTDVGAIPVTSTYEETRAAFRTMGYSRLPVFRERVDDVVGILSRRDLEPYYETPQPDQFDLEKLLNPPLFVPTTARLDTVLRQMQSSRIHLAVVVDEHGGMEGIVTLEDLLEEIVGEINDEFDEEVREQIVKQFDGTYILDGMLAVRDANRELGLQLPEDASYTTIAGFLIEQTGRLLMVGEKVEYQGALFIIENMDEHRINRIRFRPAEPV